MCPFFINLGEGHRDELIDFVGAVLEVFSDEVEHCSLPISAGTAAPHSYLFYPTKVSVHNDSLIISDCGNHRIIICSRNGHVEVLL